VGVSGDIAALASLTGLLSRMLSAGGFCFDISTVILIKSEK
jgi:hypothetical protein